TPSNHFANFLKACKGEEKTRSPFAISGPLSQVFSLGVIAQRLNAKLEFDPDTKRITNNSFADALLTGPSPRKGWEQYFRSEERRVGQECRCRSVTEEARERHLSIGS